jgi:hypothetical protein
MANLEKEKIKNLIAMKEGKEIEKKEVVEKKRVVKKEKIEGLNPYTFLGVSKLKGPSLPSKYGICAYTLNFPDPIDKRLNKDGDGIWLHATPIERPPYNSEGCIVVSDKDMKELIPYINVGKTFICISKGKAFLNFPYLKEIKNTVGNWKIICEKTL